jgi:hypothetical protein
VLCKASNGVRLDRLVDRFVAALADDHDAGRGGSAALAEDLPG